jgi:hypothetical protein
MMQITIIMTVKENVNLFHSHLLSTHSCFLLKLDTSSISGYNFFFYNVNNVNVNFKISNLVCETDTCLVLLLKVALNIIKQTNQK